MHASELSEFLWPGIIERALPKRPVVFMTQSSMWDSVCYHQSNKSIPGPLTESTLRSWSWRERAGEYFAAVHRSRVPIERMLWRTNPDCPLGVTIVTSASEAQRREIYGLQASLPFPLEVVDWRAQYVVKRPEQCKNVHFQSEGYEALWESLGAVLDGRLPPPDGRV
mmetsp:Transcript_132158/g.410710  ORF Transcript_132158/g.410710 Transcript_132158/m.410710 type:complete len:167 (+) Transcript_132158:505-1005(+)